MPVIVANAQREAVVNVAQMTRVARSAIRHLKIRTHSAFTITFISSKTMRALNRTFLRHDRPTDVLTFRYDGEPVVGEILIAPQQARAYAKAHALSYQEELARYVVHGFLHWLGHEDRTAAQQRTMRAMENQLLARCL